MTQMIVVPILITSALTLAASISAILAFQKNQKTCREIALSAQEIQAHALEKLMAKNTDAKSLRAQEVSLKLAIAAAAVTPGAQSQVDKLYLLLRKVKKAQIELAVQQKSLILKANLEATSVANSKSPQLPAQNVRLRVHAKDPAQTASQYELDLNFEKAQALKYNYKLALKNILPGWLIKLFINVEDLKMQCGSTIKQKEKKWTPVLTMDN